MTGFRCLMRTAAVAAALFAAASGISYADSLAVDGLGTIPLSGNMTVTDCGNSPIERALVSEKAEKGFKNTAKAAIIDVVAVPPGMELYPARGPRPFDKVHLYQIAKKDPRGEYTAALFLISGTDRELFPKERDRQFWESAFHEDSTRPSTLFGMPRITLSEYQKMFNSVLSRASGERHTVKVLSFSPWNAYQNNDGSYRWQQSARVVVTDSRGVSFPMWVDSSLYKEGNRYYLIYLEGSHSAAGHLTDSWLGSLYRLKRDNNEQNK